MPGPVHFNVPTDVAAAEQPEGKPFAPVGVRTLPRRDDRGPIEALLKKARRPLALVGVGVQIDGAERELKRFLEAWRIPFICTYKAKGVVPEDHPL